MTTSDSEETTLSPSITDDVVEVLLEGGNQSKGDLPESLRVEQVVLGSDSTSDSGKASSSRSEEPSKVSEESSIYTFEGTDYKADEEALQKLKEEVAASKGSSFGGDSDADRAQQRAQALERAKEKKEETERRKWKRKFEKWLEAGYNSFAIGMPYSYDPSTEDVVPAGVDLGGDRVPKGVGGLRSDEMLDVDEDEGPDADAGGVNYVTGNIVDPKVHSGECGILVHVVDDSGQWSNRGVFAALSSLDPNIENVYQEASANDDLTLGTVQLIPIDSSSPSTASPPPKKSSSSGSGTSSKTTLFVALVVAQKRNANTGFPGGIVLPRLDEGLKKVAEKAREMGASVHLPRIGQSIQGFDWYQAERIIRKLFRGVPTYIYYYRPQKRKPSSSYSDHAPSDRPSQRMKTSPPSASRTGTTTDEQMNIDIDMPAGNDDDVTPESTARRIRVHRRLVEELGIRSPFPDTFVGKTVLFVGIADEEVAGLLGRWVVAYGGSTSPDFDENVTHVILGDDERQVSRWFEKATVGDDVKVQPVDWLVRQLG
ncbi:Chromodomain-helicase-DNA-binding protein 1-like [Quaeritorhiza haematococci]|nr:Chromodomain-helicase-DNA-binding protein 1-like [Quaeritorhiza haematococci]